MRATLASQHLSLHPGVSQTLDVEVVNTSDVIDGVAVSVRGIEPTWVTIVPPIVTLFPDAIGHATLTFDVPPSCPAGDSLVLVELVSTVDPTRRLDQDVWITVDPVVVASLQLRPSVIRGGSTAEFHAVITNTGNAPTEFHVDTVEPTRVVECRTLPPTIVVPPGESHAVEVHARGRRPWFSQVATRNLKVTVASPTLTLTETARFDQKPRIARGVITAIILACIIALWATIFLLVVNLLRSQGDPKKAVPASWNAHGAKDVPLEDVAGSIDGTVTAGTTGDGIARMTVEAYRVKPHPDGTETTELASSAATKDDGTYDLAALLPGSYRLKVSGDGYDDVWYPAAAEPVGAEIVKIDPLEPVHGLNVVLAGQKGTLAGKIAPPDGADPTSPVTVTVKLVPAHSGNVVPPEQTVTTTDGSFSVGGLDTPANYQVRVERANFDPQVFDVALGGGQSTVLDTAKLEANNGSIAGKVTDANGQALGGVKVTVRSGTIEQVSTTPTTGDIGAFNVENLPTPRTYVLTFELPGFSSSTVALDLAGGQPLTGVSAVLVGGQASITGAVRDTAGNPLGGVLITVNSGTFTATTSSLTSGTGAFGAGSYTISGLQTPASYTVTFELAGYSTETLSVGFLAASTRGGVDVVMHPVNGSLRGTITRGGAGVGGLTVDLLDGTTTRTTQTATGPAGAFDFVDIVPGAYTLRVTGPGIQPYVAVIDIAAGQAVTRDIAVAAA